MNLLGELSVVWGNLMMFHKNLVAAAILRVDRGWNQALKPRRQPPSPWTARIHRSPDPTKVRRIRERADTRVDQRWAESTRRSEVLQES